MPTNLPPEYFSAEERYKQASTNQEKIDRLEELIGTIPKHKGTDKLRADLRRRLSRLKESAEKGKKTGKHESTFHIEKEGSGRVILVGLPNVGKSSLIATITHAKPTISEAPFSSWTPTPGMMEWEHVQIQLIDTPPLNREHMESEQFDLIRSADLLLLLVDLQADAMQQLEDARDILLEHQIPIRCRQNVDKILASQPFIPVLVAINKCDDESFAEDLQLFLELSQCDWPTVAISSTTGYLLDELQTNIFRELNIIRVYSKPPGKPPDHTAPFVLKKGSTVEELAGSVHKDFLSGLKSARIWGTGVHDGQQVGRDHVLYDGDIVELHA
ncbi:MAG: TGS domain-containing protein [Calditrichae bacterium]|nr:TGS domain-containing protein [Calditrichia bacterium]